jgi:eukaryotic-like serine/threonine-protein kinase
LSVLDAIQREGEGGQPWFYEPDKLRGDVLTVRAARRWNAGDHGGALADLEGGRAAYARAAAIGESVPAVHRAAGELEYTALQVELYGEGDVEPAFERGIAATARALTAQPDHPACLVLAARLRRRMAEHRGNQGISAHDLLREAISAAESALAVAPENPSARMELGQIYWQWGQSRSERAEDPQEQLRKAAEIFSGFRPEDRDYDFHLNVGLVFDSWADYEEQTGADPRPNRGKAIDAYRSAAAMDEHLPHAWLNLGNAYYLRAAGPQSERPDQDLEQAAIALDKALALNPENAVAYYYKGETHKLLALRSRARGGDAGPGLSRALELYRRGLAINPGLSYLCNGVGSVLLDQAREAWDRGEDPEPLLREAQAAYERAIAVAPEQGFGYHNAGEALAYVVHYAHARGEDPTRAARAAIPAILRAVERLPDHAEPRALLGMVYSILAAFELSQGRNPEPSLTQAFAALAAALERNPADGQSYLFLGQARATQARFRAKRGQGGDKDFDEAASAYQKAMDISPEDQDIKLAFGHFWRARAESDKAAGRDPTAALQRGLSLAEALLSVRPGWPDARALRASLVGLSTSSRP